MQIENNSRFRIPVCLGTGADGKELTIDLTETPNLLVAGKGPAKDTLIERLIGSVIGSGSPGDVRLIVSNLGEHSLEKFETDPHMFAFILKRHTPTTTGVFGYLCDQIDRRLSLFAGVRARNISMYNEIAPELSETAVRLPYLVYVIDDISGLMQTQRTSVNRYVKRISAISRYVGIHLVLGAEIVHPSVVTGTIISNFPSQICFRTENRNQSRMILDHDGAETLEPDELMYQCRGDSLVHRVRMQVRE